MNWLQIDIDSLRVVQDIIEGSYMPGPRMPRGCQYLSEESSQEFEDVE